MEDSRRLVDLRRDRALSIHALAALSGVSSRTIQRMERGETIRMDPVGRLARALGVEPLAIREYAEQREREKQATAQDGS